MRHRATFSFLFFFRFFFAFINVISSDESDTDGRTNGRTDRTHTFACTHTHANIRTHLEDVDVAVESANETSVDDSPQANSSVARSRNHQLTVLRNGAAPHLRYGRGARGEERSKNTDTCHVPLRFIALYYQYCM